MSRTVLLGLGVLAGVAVLGLMASQSIKTPGITPITPPEDPKQSNQGSGLFKPGTLPTAANVLASSPNVMQVLQNPAIPLWGKQRFLGMVVGRVT